MQEFCKKTIKKQQKSDINRFNITIDKPLIFNILFQKVILSQKKCLFKILKPYELPSIGGRTYP